MALPIEISNSLVLRRGNKRVLVFRFWSDKTKQNELDLLAYGNTFLFKIIGVNGTSVVASVPVDTSDIANGVLQVKIGKATWTTIGSNKLSGWEIDAIDDDDETVTLATQKIRIKGEDS